MPKTHPTFLTNKNFIDHGYQKCLHELIAEFPSSGTVSWLEVQRVLHDKLCTSLNLGEKDFVPRTVEELLSGEPKESQ